MNRRLKTSWPFEALAFYGMFGQMEGENIRTRTDDVRKQFPSRIFGYTRKKEENKVTFLIDNNKKELITALFNDFCSANSEEQFIDLLLIRRAGLANPERVLRLLTNPFYSAHYETKNGEPLVSLETFLAVQLRIDK